MTRMTKNNVDIWHKMRFIAIPVLAIAAHFLMSNILYYAVENLFLNVLHIPEAQFVKFAYLGELLVYIALILIFFVAYKIIWKHEENEAGTEMNLRDSALSFMAGVGVTGISFLWIMLAEQVPALQKSIDAMEAANRNIAGGNVLGGILIAVIAAPLIEEILFRGIVFRSIRRISPAWVAILLSAILFGVYHMNVVQAVYATAMGAVAGIIYEKKKNLMFPVLVHIANNFIAAMEGFAPPEVGEMINVLSLVMILPLGYIIYRLLRCERRDCRDY